MDSTKELPLVLGIHGTYKGYHYLVTTLEIATENEDKLYYITKNIFPLVAKKYNTNVHCVERNIRTVILNCWNSPYRHILQRISPCPLFKPPSVCEFIDILYWALKSYESIKQRPIEYTTEFINDTSFITEN